MVNRCGRCRKCQTNWDSSMSKRSCLFDILLYKVEYERARAANRRYITRLGYGIKHEWCVLGVCVFMPYGMSDRKENKYCDAARRGAQSVPWTTGRMRVKTRAAAS